MDKSRKKLMEMLTYKRKEGSVGQELFNKRFIRPLMGKPDIHGNYLCEVMEGGKVLTVGNATKTTSKIAFMAHHDTVHKTDGRQKVFYDPIADIAYVDGTECLGADCTTGVWLILEMIKAKVPGLYIIHTGEECGGIGSGLLVKSKPEWINHIEAAISFDRMGTKSIITHQMGIRTCSNNFGDDLASILDLDFNLDSGGVYTDSYEYADLVSECTNISVGYYNQHTAREHQDMGFALKLKDALVKANWSKLRGYRDPSVVDYDDYSWTAKKQQGGMWTNYGSGSTYVSRFDSDYDLYDRYSTEDDNLEVLKGKYTTMEKVIEEFPYEVAEILSEYGYNKDGLLKDILNFHRTSIAF